MKLTPYQRIVKNADQGKGVHLSPGEAWALANDDNIREQSARDDEIGGSE